jgi:hypothetical protein
MYVRLADSTGFSQPQQYFSLTQNQPSHQPTSQPTLFSSHAKSASHPASQPAEQGVVAYYSFIKIQYLFRLVIDSPFFSLSKVTRKSLQY